MDRGVGLIGGSVLSVSVYVHGHVCVGAYMCVSIEARG